MTSVLPSLPRCSRNSAARASGLRKEKRMSEYKWYVLKIASLVLAVMGMAALVMTIVMGQNGAQGY